MADFLLFQLYGPLASWGEPAVGEYRPSATHPGKSQIVGLLGAALGLRRDQEGELAVLAESLGLAVRIDAEGELLRDYHTTQVPPSRKGQCFHTRRDELSAASLYTILSQRDYRMDAAWSCALWSRGESWPLESLAEALERPRYVPYLGRKACPPALPFNPRLLQADNLKEAFDQYVLDAVLRQLLVPEGKKRYFWEEPLPVATGFDDQEFLWVTQRRDRPGSRHRWQFGVRDEHHARA